MKKIIAILFVIIFASCSFQTVLQPSQPEVGQTTLPTVTATKLYPTPTERPLPTLTATPDYSDPNQPIPKTIKITTENALELKEIGRIGSGSINSAVFSPDGTMIGVATGIGVYVYRTSTLELISYLPSKSTIYSISFSPDAKLIATIDIASAIAIWNINNREILSIWEATENLYSVDFSSDGNILLTLADNKLIAWNLNVDSWSTTIQVLYETSCIGMVGHLAISPNGETFICGTSARNMSDGETVIRYQPPYHNSWVVALSGDGTKAAAGGTLVVQSQDGSIAKRDTSVYVWNAADGERVNEFKIRSEWIHSIAISPDGNLIAVSTEPKFRQYYPENAEIQFWETVSGKLLKVEKINNSFIRDLRFSKDGKTLMAVDILGSKVLFWQVEDLALTNQKISSFPVMQSLTFSPKQKVLSSGGKDGLIYLWDVETKDLISTWEAHEGEITSISYSPDGSVLASSGSDSKIRLWDGVDGHLIGTINGYESISSIDFSPDGTLIAAGTNEGIARIWRTSDRILIATLNSSNSGQKSKFCQGRVTGVAFSSDGRMLASAYTTGCIPGDNKISLWDIRSQRNIKNLTGVSFGAYELVSSPKDSSLLAPSNQRLLLWRDAVTSGYPLVLSEDSPVGVSFSTQNELIAAGINAGDVAVWDFSTGKKIKELTGHGYYVLSTIFSPQDELLITSGADGTIRFWGVMP